jgi:hypothetical protein
VAAAGLDFRLMARDIAAWEPQVRIPIVVNGLKVCTYVCDFRVTHNDGSIELVEVKGYWTREALLKAKLLRATFLKENPTIKFTIT